MPIPYRVLDVKVGSGTWLPRLSCPNKLSNNFFSSNTFGLLVAEPSCNNNHSVCRSVLLAGLFLLVKSVAMFKCILSPTNRGPTLANDIALLSNMAAYFIPYAVGSAIIDAT